MKTAIALAAFGLGASSIPSRPTSTIASGKRGDAFKLTGKGPASAHGLIGQLGDGQNRFGGGHPVGDYILKDGKVWDAHGRGCILTPPTTQWQCDEGATPTGGFDVSCNGQFQYHGSSQFYACPVNDHGEWNIYSQPAPGQRKCVAITLMADRPGICPPAPPLPHTLVPVPSAKNNCNSGEKADKHGNCLQSSLAPPPYTLIFTPSATNHCHNGGKADKHGNCPPPPSATPMSALPTQASPAKTCPGDLSGSYEFPHLIIPVDKSQPDTPQGNRFNGTVGSNKCTIFNFDINAKDAGKQCSAHFLFPEQSQLETSAYSFSGHGNLTFSWLESCVNQSTTWNNKPKVQQPWNNSPVRPGQNVHAGSHACQAGDKIAIEMCSSDDLYLDYFQDWNPSPIGLYMTIC